MMHRSGVFFPQNRVELVLVYFKVFRVLLVDMSWDSVLERGWFRF